VRKRSSSDTFVDTRSASEQKMARGLGWFSVGLGIAALFMPRGVARIAGLSGRTGLVRLIGARELAAGVGLLTQKKAAPWLWSRVAGDVMDLTTLGVAAALPTNSGRGRATGALLAVAGITALDARSAIAASGPGTLSMMKRMGIAPSAGADATVQQSMIVNRSPQECYEYWRDAKNLSRFMRRIESVQQTGEKRSHWIARGPGGIRMEWDTEITEEKPGEHIAWRSLEGSELDTSGSVSFGSAPGGRGTLVRLIMRYTPPAGAVGKLYAKVLGSDPSSEVRESLRRFKSLLETGEIPTTDGQPSGERSWLGRTTPDGRRSREGTLNGRASSKRPQDMTGAQA